MFNNHNTNNNHDSGYQSLINRTNSEIDIHRLNNGVNRQSDMARIEHIPNLNVNSVQNNVSFILINYKL